MDNEEFRTVFAQQIRICEDVLVDKAREYADDVDRLRNFKSAAHLEQRSQKQALAGMMAKHTISIYDMCALDEDFSMDTWSEKITDHINYLILLKAVVCEEYLDTAQRVLPFSTGPDQDI